MATDSQIAFNPQATHTEDVVAAYKASLTQPEA